MRLSEELHSQPRQQEFLVRSRPVSRAPDSAGRLPSKHLSEAHLPSQTDPAQATTPDRRHLTELELSGYGLEEAPAKVISGGCRPTTRSDCAGGQALMGGEAGYSQPRCGWRYPSRVGRDLTTLEFCCRTTMPTRSASCKASAPEPVVYPVSSNSLLDFRSSHFCVPRHWTQFHE